MNGTASRFFQLSGSLAGLVVLGWVLTGQAARPARHGIPLPTDWSHRHLIFSRTTSAEQLAQVSKDPRYWQQMYRREESAKLAIKQTAGEWGPIHPPFPKKQGLARDWAMTLGSASSSLAGLYPAKYSYDSSTANCGNAATPDYVVYSTGESSSTSQASIVAFDNLYSGCPTGTGPVPTTYWAYNTSNTSGSLPVPGIVVTSPIASLDGTQVAFVQTDGIGHGTVVLLKWAANNGSVGSPAAPTLDSAAQYASCATPPCMVQFNLTDTHGTQVDDETSSIYYDFSNDVAWVGDNIGLLHQFHPFFLGTPSNPPAEVTSSTWPATVSGSWLSSPVYDSGSNNVFVGDGGGYVHAVSVATGGVTSSGQLDFGVGIVEGPLVDSGNGFVYVFASRDNTTGCGFSTPCAGVYQLSTAFTSGDTGKEVKIGLSKKTSAGNPNPTYLGGFDSAYYNSGTATGNLYVCGTTGSTPQLWQVPVVAGAMSQPSASFVTLASTTTPCSPVTDVPNPNTTGGPSERLFVSVQDKGNYTACASGGCVMNFLDTPWLASTSYSIGQLVLDSNFDVEMVVAAGTSSGTQPSWPPKNTIGGTPTTDGGVKWLAQGPLSIEVAAWAASHSYALNTRVLDSNNNVEIVTAAGTSGSSTPAWNTHPNGNTPDGTVTWINANTVGTFALPAVGGSSGIISDNVVPSTTLAGASQIYFTTLGTQTCATSGTSGGCAVQASQPALQ